MPEAQSSPLEEHVQTCLSCLESLKVMARSDDTLVELLSKQTQCESSPPSPFVVSLIEQLKALPRPAKAPDDPMIRFRCSSCQKPLGVKKSLSGKKVKCPGCGLVLSVPQLSAPAPMSEQTLPSQHDSLPNVNEVTAVHVSSGSSPSNPASEQFMTVDSKGPEAGVDANMTSFLSPSLGPDELGRLGKFRILQILGRGGMGVVYKAEDSLLKRTVALKAMLPNVAAGASAGKRFLREAQSLAAVEHDHVVRVHEVAEERGVAYLAMEFLKGEPLDARLERENVLPIREVVRISKEIAEGLSAAHERGLIHRDIKPANVWLEAPRGRVKILDFGLARAGQQEAGLTQEGAIIGTPAYMAPEQARGGDVTGRTDLFSLGVLIYRISCGKSPFHGKDTISTLTAVALDEPPAPIEINPDLPPELSELVMRLLEKDPAGRPASATELAETLRALETKLQRSQEFASQTAVVPAALLAPSSPPKRAISSRGNRVPLLAGLLLLIAGLAAAGLWAAGVFRYQTDEGDLVLETDDPDFAFAPLKGGGLTLEDRKLKRTYQLKAVSKGKDEYELEVTDPDANLVFKTKTFGVQRGKTVALKAWFERKGTTAEPPVASQPPSNDAWIKEVAKLPAEKQVEAVVAKLRERNAGWAGEVSSKVEGGKVVGFFVMGATRLTDLTPVRALPGLEFLTCMSADPKLPGLTNLSPLKGLRLKGLYVANTPVADLSPVAGMPLESVEIGGTKVSSLAPLRGAKLKWLKCAGSPVTDLSPLKGMPLESLECFQTGVSDLSPLKGMPLKQLTCWSTAVKDLSPLDGMPLEFLHCSATGVSDLSPLKGTKLQVLYLRETKVVDLSPIKDLQLRFIQLNDDLMRSEDALKILRSMKTLENINDQNLTEFWKARDAAAKPLPALPDAWFKEVAKLSPEKQLEAVVAKLQQRNLGWDGKVEHKIEGNTVISLWMQGVSDIVPVRALAGLTDFSCVNGRLSDLSPLRGLPLIRLNIYNTPVSDLAPLQGMKLTTLEFQNTRVADLTPLTGMPLEVLRCTSTRVSDLKPLKGMKLTRLFMHDIKPKDISPLKDMPLKELGFGEASNYVDVIRSIKTLEKINDKPAADFWKEVEGKAPTGPIDDAWVKEIAKLPAEKQVEAVTAKLKERNPNYENPLNRSKSSDGVVVELHLAHGPVADISPLRVLTGLQTLEFHGFGNPIRLKDLSPLRGLKLKSLRTFWFGGSDLTPLQGMPLEVLQLRNSAEIADLSPLKGMQLKSLDIDGQAGAKVSDLSPLKGMPLTSLAVGNHPVADLTPLQGMALEYLNIQGTAVKDLSPLRGLPLKTINCDIKPEYAEILRSIKTLKTINAKPAAEFWKAAEAAVRPIPETWFAEVAKLPAEKQVEAVTAKLKERNSNWDGKLANPIINDGVVTGVSLSAAHLSDLLPLRAWSELKILTCQGPNDRQTPSLNDLSPLAGMKLTLLGVPFTRVSDLKPLKGMKLTYLNCGGTLVSSLLPLADMPLGDLNFSDTQVKDLSPLAGMPLKHVLGDFQPQRDAAILRSIKTLEKINNKPAAEFWKEFDVQPMPKKP
jgi:Leucine-rich repeat (LRR) protein